MTIAIALRIAPQLPISLCGPVASIMERTVREENPNLSDFDTAREVRSLMGDMDASTAVAILCAERRGN
jgi:hypothetical protein